MIVGYVLRFFHLRGVYTPYTSGEDTVCHALSFRIGFLMTGGNWWAVFLPAIAI